MTDTSDSFTSRSSRTTPEAIAERTFSQVKRGYAESEVRAYLRMVSSDFSAAASRERELAARVRELEEQLSRPALPPSDQDLINALGEETARVLGQARESAIELKNKAEEHARRVVREAQETARELRATTQQAVEAKTREAEDAARNRAKEIVGEARALRERVLADLEGRRKELEAQVVDLRAGRGKLVETYELVERALAHAARVIAEEPSTPPVVPATDEPAPASDDAPTTATPAPAPSAPSAPAMPPAPAPSAPAMPPAPAPSAPAASERAPEPTPRADAAAQAEADAADQAEPTTDVGALFEKLRSERTDAPEPSPSTEPDDAPGDGAAAPTDHEPATAEAAAPEEGAREEGAREEDAPEEDAPDDVADGVHPASRARDDALADATDDLVRRGKRALQDEQNDLLDGLRRQRGKIDTAQVLPALDDQVARWAHVIQPAVDAAYSAGAATVEGSAGAGSTPRGLLTELSTSVVSPLRERLAASLEQIDARTPADTEIAIAQRLGARYREWRGEQLEGVLGDALAVAWSRGVFDAAPDGARLTWIPAVVGKCPDCDDNALEPTVKGSDFPTGQPHPPAHPGCRCLLVVETD
jgi:DivIVA domain-containing protein